MKLGIFGPMYDVGCDDTVLGGKDYDEYLNMLLPTLGPEVELVAQGTKGWNRLPHDLSTRSGLVLHEVNEVIPLDSLLCFCWSTRAGPDGSLGPNNPRLARWWWHSGATHRCLVDIYEGSSAAKGDYDNDWGNTYMSQERKFQRWAFAVEYLSQHDVELDSRMNGLLIVRRGDKKAHFWPSTGKWRPSGRKKGCRGDAADVLVYLGLLGRAKDRWMLSV